MTLRRNRGLWRGSSGTRLTAAAAAVILPASLISTVGFSTASGATTTPNASSAPGVSSKTIKIGLVASITGFASSSFGPDVVTGATAAIKQINAEGGINGRKLSLVVVDDASSTTQDPVAVQSLISKGVFGIVESTPFFFGGYKTTVTQGIPVTGTANDGPEWGSSANPNLFSAWGSPATNYPTFTKPGNFLKGQGVTKLAGIAYADSPSSLGASAANVASAKNVGIPTVYQDTSQNVGEANWSADTVAIKNAGANGLETVLGTADNLAILQGLKQQGVSLKAELIADGYQQAVLSSPSSVSAAQGIMFQSRYAPTELNTSATKAFQSALAKYGNYTAANPTQGLGYGWFPMELMIKGLQVAGQHPTWGSFIQNLHKVTNYTANGMTAPVNYGKYGYYDSLTAGNCFYVVKVSGQAFVPVSTKPYCGTAIAGTSN